MAREPVMADDARPAHFRHWWRSRSSDSYVASSTIDGAFRDERIATPRVCDDCGQADTQIQTFRYFDPALAGGLS